MSFLGFRFQLSGFGFQVNQIRKPPLSLPRDGGDVRGGPFTTETPSSQRSECFLIENSLLCALSASALKIVADQSSG